MNIFMTGASGTGKTSLAKELCERLGLREASSVSRTSPYGMRTQIHQDYVMHGVDMQCITARESVVTRTPIDVYAYSWIWDLEHVVPLAVATRFLLTKPILLYLPKYWEPEDDGVRPLDGQDDVDATIKFTIDHFQPVGFEYFTAKDNCIEDRASDVIEWLIERNLLNASISI